MLAEAINAIGALQSAADVIQIEHVEGVHDCAYMKVGGEVTKIEFPAPVRDHTLSSRDSFVAWVLDDAAVDVEIYVSPKTVHAFLDRTSRIDQIRVPLERTAAFETLTALAARPFRGGVVDTVKFLRFSLPDLATGMVQALRRVDFKRTSTGGVTAEHGNEALGKSVELRVQQAEDIPEVFVVDVPVFRTPGFDGLHVKINVGVYLDTDAQMVQLETLPDQIPQALDRATAHNAKLLSDALEGEDVPVFEGTP